LSERINMNNLKWPWTQFPEDSSTWEACIREYEKLYAAHELIKRSYLQLLALDEKEEE